VQTWEYYIWHLDSSIDAAAMRDDLERQGREGWELVSVVPSGSGQGTTLIAIFKRPAQS
jgi:Domain of unknown function (DUF4177)